MEVLEGLNKLGRENKNKYKTQKTTEKWKIF